MLHYGRISWNIPGQHRHAKVHGLLEQQQSILPTHFRRKTANDKFMKQQQKKEKHCLENEMETECNKLPEH